MSRARGLRVQGRGLSVLGSEYRNQGLWALGSGFGVRVQRSGLGLGFRIWIWGLGSGLRV